MINVSKVFVGQLFDRGRTMDFQMIHLLQNWTTTKPITPL
jgi:hypothetical protein